MKKFIRIYFYFFCFIFSLSQQVSASDSANIIADELITTKVNLKIAMDKSISIFKVNVSTNNMIVKLNGTVDSDTQAESLVELAQETEGVIDVNTDNLVVKDSKRPIIDSLITAKVMGQLIKNKIITRDNSNSVEVEVKDGIAYLSGNVKKQDIINSAIEFTKLVRGVQTVESRLKIIP
jgi:hyperosmotically inducible protein